MDLLVGLLSLVVGLLGLAIGRSHHHRVIERLRDQARLRVIEGQLAALRSTLRIQVAEQVARRRLQVELNRHDVFANPTIREEPDEWRR